LATFVPESLGDSASDLAAHLSKAGDALDALEAAPEVSAPVDVPAPAVEPPAPSAVPEPPPPAVQATPAPVAPADQAIPAVQSNSELETLKSQLAELKAALEAKSTPAPEVKTDPPTTPQELQELDIIINGYSQQFVAIENELAGANQQKAQWANHLNELYDKLADADSDPEINVAKVRAEIGKVKNVLGRYEQFISAKAQERAGVITNYRTQTTLRQTTERLLKLSETQERAQQESVERSLDNQANAWRKDKWEPAKQAAASKIPENQRARFEAYVEKLGKAHVNSRNEKGQFQNPISDPAQFVQSAADDFLAILRDAAAAYTTSKVTDIPATPAPGAAAAPATPTTKGPKSWEDMQREIDEQWRSAVI
jgi:chromosome segregation ATPase